MFNSTTPRRLVFTGKQQVALESFDLKPLEDNLVRVRTQVSLMSTGTENIVFNRLFDPGTHWDWWVKYPFYPGYASVGTVEEIGSGVKNLKVGDRVGIRGNHRSHQDVKEEDCFPIPAELPWDEAVWFPLAKIAYHGALVANYKLGDTVLIIGAGPIGQMSIRWARAAGCASIIVVDPVPDRMELAKKGGATATIVEPISSAREAILAAGQGKQPRVVIDSTGNASVFSAALGLVAKYGKVVILGDTGSPAQQVLTPDVITRGITIVGAHDGHNTEEWNNTTIAQLFFSLAVLGRFPLADLNKHRFMPEQCKEAYETANRDRAKTMGIVFDWSKE